jgi:hypothetical protein
MWHVSSWAPRNRRWATPIVVVALLAGSLAPALVKPVAADSSHYLSGTVTNGAGTALHGYHVDILLADGAWYTWTLTDDSGLYRILLPEGSYKVQFKDDTYDQYASGLFYGAAGGLILGQSNATVVSLTSDVTLDTVALPPGYSISGTVSGSDGPGLAGIKVDISCMTADLTNDFVCDLGETSMDGGSYMIGGLLAGSYKVRFSDPSGTYVDGFYGATGFTADPDEAAVVSVPPATTLNVVMPLGVHLSGRVTDPHGNGLPNMQVSVNIDSGRGPGPSFGGPTGPNGFYSLAVLPGTYTVNVQDFSTGTYLGGCYGGGNYVSDPSTCATVTVGTSAVSGIDVVMTLGAHITGTVSDPFGNGLPDIQVTANPGNIVAWGTANAGSGGAAIGWYALTLPSGDYTVSFHDRFGGYPDGCYASGVSGDFTTDPSACTPVTVGTSDVEIDVTMPFATPQLTITAPSGTMIFGGSVPALIPSYSGFIKGGTAASLTTQPTCTTTATSASPVGTYPVTCSGAVSAKYSFSYVAGMLTIAIADRFVTPMNTTLNVAAPGFLALTGGTGATVVVSTQPAGKLTLGSGGAFTYVPKAGFKGTDSFAYRLNTNGSLSAPVTVTIYVVGTGMNCSKCNLSGLTVPGVSLTGANLSSANLTGTRLDHANLTGANLSSAALSYAALDHANLTGANLSSAVLSNATLTYANLTGANLSKATLTNAALTGANLTGANLSNANLPGATLTGATITGVAWSNAVCPDGSNSSKNGGTCVGHLNH